MIDVLKGVFDVNCIETKTSIEVQNYRLGKLEDENYGIFYAALRYNGRNMVYELTIKSIKRIPKFKIHKIN